MKKYLLTLVLAIFTSASSAQSFVSIDPDSAMPGQTLNTLVTGQGFNFTWSSAPSVWGDFYMIQGFSNIFPNSVTIIDDDNISVNWSIPANAPAGHYEVVWNHWVPWCPWCPSDYYIPGGFEVVGCAPPAATITPASATSFCYPGSVTLNANTGTGLTYQWYRYNNLIPGATNSSYVSTVSGNYVVVVTNASGCTNTSAVAEVRVHTKPDAEIFTIGDAEFCPGSSKLLTANAGAGLTYQWHRNGSPVAGANNINFTATREGYYKVLVTNAGGCTKMSLAQFVDKLAPQTAEITPLGPLTFCPGGSVVLSANTGSALSYQWTKNNNTIPGATGNTYTATHSGAYRVIVTNADGCFKKSAKVIVDANCRLAAADDDEIITVFPNPAIDVIEISGVDNAIVTIIDVTGKVVTELENISGALIVNFLPPGIYMLRIAENDKQHFRKLVKN